jgi:5-methylcytosine-specific restriction endonuclease McrA
MGKRRKPEPATVLGTCFDCQVKPQRIKGYNSSGQRIYSASCGTCDHNRNPNSKKIKRPASYWRNWRNWKQYSYTKSKGSSCEKCGFIAEDPCQLDVDHIDGNHLNNHPDNLQTLCANCHRLKTKVNGDGFYRRVSPPKNIGEK